MHQLILGLRWFNEFKRAWLYEDIKISDTQANLDQFEKHQTGMVEVACLILTGGNILLLIFLFPRNKATGANIANSIYITGDPSRS